MSASGNNRALGFTAQAVLRAVERLKLIDVASVTEGLSFRAPARTGGTTRPRPMTG